MFANLGYRYANGVAGTASSVVGGSSYSTSRYASSYDIENAAKNISTGYSQGLTMVNSYVQQGKVDDALAKWQELLAEIDPALENYPCDFTNAQEESILSLAYERLTGENIITSLTSGKTNSFLTGALEGIPIIGFFNDEFSTEEIDAKIQGKEVQTKDIAAEGIGAVLSGAGSGAAIGAAIGCAGGPFAEITVPVGAGVGALIGGAWAGIQLLCKTIF